MPIPFNSTGTNAVGIPQRYARLLGNPNTRRAVPTQYLPPNLRKLRQQAQDRKAMNDPTALLSGSALEAMARKLSGAEIDPQVQALQRQDQASQTQNVAVSQRLDQLNKQYMSYLSDAAGKAQGPFSAFFQGAQTAAPMAASEVQRDLAYSLQDTLKESAGKRADLEAQRGGLFAKNLADLRQKEFDKAALSQELGIKSQSAQTDAAAAASRNRIAQQNANTSRMQATTSRQRVLDQQRYQNAQLDLKRGIDPFTGRKLPKDLSPTAALNQWKLDYARKYGRLPSTSSGATGPGGVKFQPPATQQRYVTNYKRAQPYAQQMKKAGIPRGEAYRRLLRGAPKAVDGTKVTAARPSFADLEAKVALDQAYYGHLTPVTIKQLHRYGIRASQFGIPIKES